jgi:hypothetical protein
LSIEEIKKEETIQPRFEFRSFGQNFDHAAQRMARLSIPVPENVWDRTSDEIYIVSRTNDINNTKIRDDKMDIKTLVQTVDGFEQWNPILQTGFPLDVEVLKNEIFPALRVFVPELSSEKYTFDNFMDVVNQHPQLQAVHIHKQRFGYMVNNTICETGIVLINGARVMTISSESTVIEDIKKTLKDIGLEGIENINYLQMIKRVTGMIHKPLAN